jgi:hypothetical protein
MNAPRKNLAAFLLLSSILSLCWTTTDVLAQRDDFVLEVEQKWDTYGVGGTCIPGSHDLVVADVDNDGTKEIITGGFSYIMTNGNRGDLQAPLMIWNWDGANLTLEKSEKWSGNIGVVYAYDIDNDGRTEILTSGSIINNSQSVSALRLWNWDGTELILRGTYYNVSASSIFAADVDGDGKVETVTVGRQADGPKMVATLAIWNWDGSNLALENSFSFLENDNCRVNSVYAADLNGDGKMEIATAGYSRGIQNSSGQLCIWQWDGNNLNLKANQEWRKVENAYSLDVAGNPMGNTMVSNIKIADVDGDGVQEILSGGFTYNGNKVEAQLRISNWKNNELMLEHTEEWKTEDITEIKSITVNDVDNDGKLEIVTSGVTAGTGGFAENATTKELAQLRVWSWNGESLTLEQSKEWKVDDGVCAWQDGTADVDNDGYVEIITVGCSYKSTLCDPNLRIWSLPNDSSHSALPYQYIMGVGTILIAAILGGILYKLRNNKVPKINGSQHQT